ncbi:hypothetical protein K505DRAFT_372993 [Melanomma pulvis-pyrius CBS 109.77]|uniref:Apple domain-containing protein n=1 Tax=Melanomma pulvis-pyrius CBS 109.77 TaxID=1314802 RepID=A0A6A6XKG7_9PLEO|nr:hypothetical protein K505DRAFT_372993 [Melanomma pulvis-pyrius CBS 109.77]
MRFIKTTIFVSCWLFTSGALSLAVPANPETSTSPVDTLACGTRPGCVREEYVIEALRVTPSDCAVACEARSDCLAFQTGSGVCSLLSVKAAQAAFIDGNNECTQYSIQNKDCSNPYA